MAVHIYTIMKNDGSKFEIQMTINILNNTTSEKLTMIQQ